MNKDYLPSQKYTKEELIALNVPYVLQDSCGDLMADYLKCRKNVSSLFDNSVVYTIPGVRSLSSCYPLKYIWSECQKKRETEIFEKMRIVYRKQQLKRIDKELDL